MTDFLVDHKGNVGDEGKAIVQAFEHLLLSRPLLRRDIAIVRLERDEGDENLAVITKKGYRQRLKLTLVGVGLTAERVPYTEERGLEFLAKLERTYAAFLDRLVEE